MIDFHSHIIPNIDDGAKSITETFNLINEAKEVGFDSIIFTPHYIEGFYETNLTDRSIHLKAISDSLKERKNNIKVYLGNEIYITENIIDLLKSQKASTINNSNYVLFEMAFSSKAMNIFEFIDSLKEYHLIPILAHPERYIFIQKDPDFLNNLIKRNVLMQSNFGSFIGLYGKKAEELVKKMLKCNMIHFLGSDVHKQESIYPQIPKALNEIKKIIDDKKIEEITTKNPSLVLENRKINIEEPKIMK